jgi:hypothetical protein
MKVLLRLDKIKFTSLADKVTGPEYEEEPKIKI